MDINLPSFPFHTSLPQSTSAQVRCFSSDLSKVKITKTSHQEKSPEVGNNSKGDGDFNDNSNANASTNAETTATSTSTDDSTSNSTSQLKKNEQQQAEEELYMLQSHVRQHYQNANYTAALSTSHEILQQSTSLFGKQHPSTASAYNNIGLMHKMMGEFDDSRTNYHEALRIYEDIVGKDHASYAAALNNLGNLDRAQSMIGNEGENESHVDNDDANPPSEPLTALQRMQLNDSAVEYFEQAYNIRKVELGEEHVHTITSRTNLGGALAAQVLRSEWMRQQKIKEANEKASNTNTGEKNGENGDGVDSSKEAWPVSKYTREKWDAAEEHLRAAFRTAVHNPRGERVEVPKVADASASDSDSSTDGGIPKKSSKNLSKKEKKKEAKLRRQLKRRQQEKSTGAVGLGGNTNGNVNSGFGVGDISICTLSSAAAGQNLAVFLKSRADLLVHSAEPSASNADSDPSLDSDDMYAEAKNLYLGALRVRTALKGEFHPDTVATKFSLAELVDAVGDEAGANILRQELLDAYQVEEHANPSSDGDGDGGVSSV